jgi:hypothetical protein
VKLIIVSRGCASELNAGNNRVLGLFGDAVKSDVTNGLLPLLSDEHQSRLRTIVQEALERASIISVPARNAISKPNRP